MNTDRFGYVRLKFSETVRVTGSVRNGGTYPGMYADVLFARRGSADNILNAYTF
jgi:hypothetical protein